ncbi:hypothetical protein RIR_jg24162.t1 [Rhizophagus irregularis DAOM 181602=DAOM 197198]|nr:hypothetical protein RIR_jg24162.t1 [Rhizophagus irregularis DAOM 181602=DAOM 197198]
MHEHIISRIKLIPLKFSLFILVFFAQCFLNSTETCFTNILIFTDLIADKKITFKRNTLIRSRKEHFCHT